MSHQEGSSNWVNGPNPPHPLHASNLLLCSSATWLSSLARRSTTAPADANGVVPTGGDAMVPTMARGGCVFGEATKVVRKSMEHGWTGRNMALRNRWFLGLWWICWWIFKMLCQKMSETMRMRGFPDMFMPTIFYECQLKGSKMFQNHCFQVICLFIPCCWRFWDRVNWMMLRAHPIGFQRTWCWCCLCSFALFQCQY